MKKTNAGASIDPGSKMRELRTTVSHSPPSLGPPSRADLGIKNISIEEASWITEREDCGMEVCLYLCPCPCPGEYPGVLLTGLDLL